MNISNILSSSPLFHVTQLLSGATSDLINSLTSIWITFPGNFLYQSPIWAYKIAMDEFSSNRHHKPGIYVPSVHMDVETGRPSANGCLPPWRPGSIRGYVTVPISHWHSLVQITFDIFKFNHQISKNYFLVMKNLFQIFFCAYFWKVIPSKRFVNMTRLLSSGLAGRSWSTFSKEILHPPSAFVPGKLSLSR